jgi:hypothetical protein
MKLFLKKITFFIEKIKTKITFLMKLGFLEFALNLVIRGYEGILEER